jgi:hypothetical protein
MELLRPPPRKSVAGSSWRGKGSQQPTGSRISAEERGAWHGMMLVYLFNLFFYFFN